MKSLSNLKFAFLFLVVTATITSCSKENVEEIVETPIGTEYKMEITLRGSSTSYDAYAAYCNENGVESFSISNNAALLGNDLWSSDVADQDFVVHYRKDANSEFFLGGTIIESTFDGQPLTNFTLTDESAVDFTIDVANETEVIGSMEGDFLILINLDGALEEVPFSVTFAGQVDPAIVPIFCE